MFCDPTRFDANPYCCPCGNFTQQKYGPCGNYISQDTWAHCAPRLGRIRRTVRRLFQAVSK